VSAVLQTPAVPVAATRQSPVDRQDNAVVKNENDEAYRHLAIYQHFPREKRDAYIGRMAEELRRRSGAATVFSYSTPHVLFLLASRPRHAAGFRRQSVAVRSRWAPKPIIAIEHSGTY
jgi:hypothetical protein